MGWKEDLKLVISADDRTGPGIARARANMEGLRESATRFAGILGALGAGISLAGMAATFRSVADDLDRVSKSAQKVGISVEGLSALEFAAGQSGVEVKELETSLVKLNRSAVEAAQGTKEQAEAFGALGIQVKDTEGKIRPTEQLLMDLADRFASMEDSPMKSALAMDVFGKSGANLIPMLNQGSAGIARLMQEASDLGVVMDGEAAVAAERFNDNLDKMQNKLRGLAVAVGQDAVPAMADITDAMTQAAKEGRGLYALWVGLGGLGAMAFTDEFASAAVKAEKLKVELADLVKLRAGLEKNASGIGFVDRWFWGDKTDLDTRIASMKKQIADLLAPPKPQPSPKKEDLISPLVEAKKEELNDLELVTKAQEGVLRDANKELKQVVNERAQVAKEFRGLYQEISNAKRDANEKLTGLDLSYSISIANSAMASGDLDEAMAKARAAADLIRQAKEQGEGFSTIELQYYARRAGEVADNIMADKEAKTKAAQAAATNGLDQLLERAKGLEAIPLGINTAFAEGAVKSFHAAMQEYLRLNPLVLDVVANKLGGGSGGGDVTANALREAAIKVGYRR